MSEVTTESEASEASVAKARLYHLANGAIRAGDFGAAGTAGAVAAAFVAATSTAATGAATAVAVLIAVAAAYVAAAVVTSVAAVADAILEKKILACKGVIPVESQKKWQRAGFGLLATFSLAGGIGAGVLMYKADSVPPKPPETPTTTPTTTSFNDKSGQQDTSVIVVANYKASGLPQEERVLALA